MDNMIKENVNKEEIVKEQKAAYEDIKKRKWKIFNNRILRDEEVENSLTKADIVDINDWKKKEKKLQETYAARKKYKTLESKLKTDEIDLKRNELIAQQKMLQFELDNATIECDLAAAQQYKDYIDAVNNNNRKEIKEYLKDGQVFKKYSMACSIVSALTSCVGIYLENGSLTMWFYISCAFMLFASCVNNVFINNYVKVTSRYLDKDNILSKFVLILMSASSICVITYSVITNFIMWSMIQKNIIAVIIYSLLFDLASIVFGLLSNLYCTLNFSSKYIKKISEKHIKNDEHKNLSNACEKLDCYELGIGKNEAEKHIKNEPKKTIRKPINKSKENMYNEIIKYETGTIIKPSKCGMTGNQNYYNWIEEFKDIVKRNAQGEFVRL